ncbi:unnamed protein product, partial [Cladocopium goreaui]
AGWLEDFDLTSLSSAGAALVATLVLTVPQRTLGTPGIEFQRLCNVRDFVDTAVSLGRSTSEGAEEARRRAPHRLTTQSAVGLSDSQPSADTPAEANDITLAQDIVAEVFDAIAESDSGLHLWTDCPASTAHELDAWEPWLEMEMGMRWHEVGIILKIPGNNRDEDAVEDEQEAKEAPPANAHQHADPDERFQHKAAKELFHSSIYQVHWKEDSDRDKVVSSVLTAVHKMGHPDRCPARRMHLRGCTCGLSKLATTSSLCTSKKAMPFGKGALRGAAQAKAKANPGPSDDQQPKAKAAAKRAARFWPRYGPDTVRYGPDT